VAERVHSPASAVADITRAYRTAVNERYRFYSYGDAMLII